jgi:hypothetical protein
MQGGGNKIEDRTRGHYRRIYSALCRGVRINKVSVDAALLFVHLIVTADDFGNFLAEPMDVRYQAAPRRSQWDEARVGVLLEELASVANEEGRTLIRFYQAKGERFGHITDFLATQPAGKNGKRVRRFPECPYEVEDGKGASGLFPVNPESSSASHSHTHSHSQDHSHNPPKPPKGGEGVEIDPSRVHLIYAAYPKHKHPRDAKTAIAKALQRVRKGDEPGPPGHVGPWPPPDEFAWLLARTQAFAEAVGKWSADQQRYVPYPASWFNRGGYCDDEREWKRSGGPDGGGRPKAGGGAAAADQRRADDAARLAAHGTKLPLRKPGELRTIRLPRPDGGVPAGKA